LGQVVDDASGGGEAEDAGDVDVKLHEDGVLGVAGGVSYDGDDVEMVENVEAERSGVWWWWMCGYGRWALAEVERACDDAVEIVADVGGESRTTSKILFDPWLPLEKRTHLALHLVDLAKVEHALSDDGPRLVSSQMTLDVIMKAEMNDRWPEEPQAVGKRTLRCWRRTRAAKVTA
jgi:hypothetical protein